MPTDAYNIALGNDGARRPVLLIEITHPNLATPIRMVQDNEAITNGGNEYTPVSIGVQLAPQTGGARPQVIMWIDKFSDAVVDYLYQASGGRGATVIYKEVLKSAPDTVEAELTLVPKEVSIQSTRIQFTMGFQNTLQKKFMQVRATPDVAPNLYV